jgi:hypothetical protein
MAYSGWAETKFQFSLKPKSLRKNTRKQKNVDFCQRMKKRKKIIRDLKTENEMEKLNPTIP